MVRPNDLVISLRDVEQDDINLVGSLAAKLGDLNSLNFPVLPGFIVTSASYREFIKKNSLEKKIESLLSTINFHNHESLAQVSAHIKNLINNSVLPDNVTARVYDEYLSLKSPGVILKNNNQETTIEGEANLLVSLRNAWASIFDVPSLLSMQGKNIIQAGSPILVCRKIKNGLQGVVFTIDHENSDKNKVAISIGDSKYILDKTSFSILGKNGQDYMHDAELSLLGKLGVKVERQYYFPQEVHWIRDGAEVYITNLKPLTPKHKDDLKLTRPASSPIIIGEPANTGIKVGSIKKIEKPSQVNDVKKTDIVVVPSLAEPYMPAVKQAGAVIVESEKKSDKSVLKHATSAPAIIGAEHAFSNLKNGENVTLNAKTGKVFSGGFLNKNGMKEDIFEPITNTDVYLNLTILNDLENANSVAGVGLLSGEDLLKLNGTHPKKILEDKNKRHLVMQLADSIEKVARAYYPKPVVYKFSDFTTQQLLELRGGKLFEVEENNPLLGLHGVKRILKDPKLFKIELDAIKEVRTKKGLKNVEIMMPFVRSVQEFYEIKKIINSEGLKRSNTFKIHLLIQLPSNVIALQKFIDEGLDGITVSLDDLIMYIYGVDHANLEVASDIGINDPAIDWAIENIVHIAHKSKIPVTIYSSSSRIYQAFISKVVQEGVDGITVEGREVDDVKRMIYFAERSIINMN